MRYTFERLWTTTEVGKALRVDPVTVARWIKAGRIPAASVITTPGGHHRVLDAAVRRMLDHFARFDQSPCPTPDRCMHTTTVRGEVCGCCGCTL